MKEKDKQVMVWSLEPGGTVCNMRINIFSGSSKENTEIYLGICGCEKTKKVMVGYISVSV